MKTAVQNIKKIAVAFFLLFIVFDISAKENNAFKPFRVAVVIGDQWEDPSGYMIAPPEPTGEYSGYPASPEVSGETDFHHLMVLLKSWAVPFDIIRLDQQFLDRNMFLDMHGHPKYGAILWNVNKSENLLHPDYTIIEEMVEEFGIGLIALSDRVSQPEIQRLLGLEYIGSWQHSSKMEVKTNHFLTRGLHSIFEKDRGFGGGNKRQKIKISGNTQTIVVQGDLPQVTVNVLTSGARNVWIGGDPNSLFYYQDIRRLLRNAITWTIGYNLYKTYDNEIIMILDDPGGSQNAYLESWHYEALTKDVIEKYLIEPLKKNNAVLNINFIPGFVDDKTGRIVPAWTQQFVDEFGVEHDYVSSKRGYDKGIQQGVFEVLCHGLTHMQPDLTSEPGWYGSPVDEEKAEVGWYREFGDTRRHKEIPAAEQIWRMNTAKEWLTEQFGVVPLQFCAGGLGMSESYHNNTIKLAGKAGYGWCGWQEGYLDEDMVILKWMFSGKESPLFVPSRPDAHDYGITYAPEKFATIFKDYPDGKFISINEFIGYLHSENSGKWTGKKTLSLTLDYDPHYCRYFKDQITTWNLEFADWLISEMGSKPEIKTDGKKMEDTKRIQVTAGLGKHQIEIKF